MTKKDGGPAFPHSGKNTGEHEGMTLRDYFAAKAMQAIVSTPRRPQQQDTIRDVCHAAYAIADVMLEVRGGAKWPEGER